MSETSPPRPRPPRAAQVVDEPGDWWAPIDWSAWYLTDEEDMGQGCEQAEIIQSFSAILRVHIERQWWEDAYVGTDAFFAWVPEHPLVRVSPDVYLMRHRPPPPPLPPSWQMWKKGHRPPAFALEVVSEDWKKDYELNPAKYAQLGVTELAIFDPDTSRPGRQALQLFRRTADGAFVRTYSGAGPAYADTLDAWLLTVGTPDGERLRLALDQAGTQRVPTEAEWRKQEARKAREEKQARLEADQARLEADQARDAERAARLAAEQQLAALQAELARLKGQDP